MMRDKRENKCRAEGSMKKVGKRVRTSILTVIITAVLVVGGAFFEGNSMRYVKADGRPVSISSCTISGSDVVCRISADSVPSSDDGKYYIYADEVYQDGTAGNVVATVDAGASATAVFPLNYNTADSNLSRKFLVAVKRGGHMVQVSNEH